MNLKNPHSFHIPVMGLAYTIDTPIKVARYGISSVLSIVEDRLIEMMRKHYYPSINQDYIPITRHETDYRAKRITDYLNLVNTIVNQQMLKIKNEAFERGSDIAKYFEMLPKENPLKKLFNTMMHCTNEEEKFYKQAYLRSQMIAGRIDVNIMTKLDRETLNKNGETITDGSEAVTALKGYLNSNLTNSAVIFSAGLNPRLYGFLDNIKALDPDENFNFKKKVVVKVSDYRSALIQGKFLAKKGIWVSEFRIESGLNCGGHAFATDGFLLGPILEEFKTKRQELMMSIFEIFKVAINKKSALTFNTFPEIEITVQGGIGTHEEDKLLHDYYHVSKTGWGTPFLLVPEATTVDEATLKQLSDAREEDVELSNNSPLGVRFHYLKGTSSATEKQQRIESGNSGSPCTEKHLAFNTEFTKEPICTASKQYIKLKLEHLKTLGLNPEVYQKQETDVLAKECLCVGLSNSAAIVHHESFLKNLNSVTICPGPNIVNFSKIISLRTMIDHIYGRTDILTNRHRPHMFVAELNLYINYLKEQLSKNIGATIDSKSKSYYQTFVQNLSNAINYYQTIKENLINNQTAFKQALLSAERELKALTFVYSLE